MLAWRLNSPLPSEKRGRHSHSCRFLDCLWRSQKKISKRPRLKSHWCGLLAHLWHKRRDLRPHLVASASSSTECSTPSRNLLNSKVAFVAAYPSFFQRVLFRQSWSMAYQLCPCLPPLPRHSHFRCFQILDHCPRSSSYLYLRDEIREGCNGDGGFFLGMSGERLKYRQAYGTSRHTDGSTHEGDTRFLRTS